MFFSAESTIKWDTIKCEGKHIWLQHLMFLKCQSKNSYDIVPWNSVPFSQIFKVSLDAFQSTLHIWHHLIVTPDRVMTKVISVTGDTQLLLNFWSEQVAILRPRLRFWTSDMVSFSPCHNENGKMLTWAYRYCPSHFTEIASLILKAALQFRWYNYAHFTYWVTEVKLLSCSHLIIAKARSWSQAFCFRAMLLQSPCYTTSVAVTGCNVVTEWLRQIIHILCLVFFL